MIMFEINYIDDNDYELVNTNLLFGDACCAICGASYIYNPNKGDYYDLCDKCTEEESKSDWLYGKYVYEDL